ncbi:hypothetical protein ACIRD3_05465 [Kitasatospora sp. NPDC093550]|uniref:hypothetical protein n=1 Tax=Kitasatospora sp. NPDC093550 TaxID=3364089 RepID=UPI00382D2A7A
MDKDPAPTDPPAYVNERLARGCGIATVVLAVLAVLAAMALAGFEKNLGDHGYPEGRSGGVGGPLRPGTGAATPGADG